MRAVYPGTFDPVTFGHLDIIIRASKMVSRLIIAVAPNLNKRPLLPVELRASLIKEELRSHNVEAEVTVLTGLLVDFMAQNEIPVIIRGLRTVSDFESEFQISWFNHNLNPNIETLFLLSSQETRFISSRFIKEIIHLQGDVSKFISPQVANCLKSHLPPPYKKD